MNKPVIHFSHANGIPSACYRKMLNHLSDDFTIKTLPMIGMSPEFPVEDNWHALADEVAHSIRQQSSEPVIGVGHSLGAVCTFMAAYKYPELFKGIVLMDPPTINGPLVILFAFMKMIGQIDRVTPAGVSKHRREFWPSRDEARKNMGSKKFFQAFDPECFEDYIQYGLSDAEEGVRLTVPVATEIAIFRSTPTDIWRYRSPLKVPGAFIAGAESEFIKADFGVRMARRHHMDYRVTPGGHMFPLENPELTAKAIRAGIKAVLTQ